MSEIKTLAEIYAIEYLCDIEGCSGTVIHTGMAKTSTPPLFEHRCTECGDVSYLGKQYPSHEIRPIPNRPVIKNAAKKLTKKAVKKR